MPTIFRSWGFLSNDSFDFSLCHKVEIVAPPPFESDRSVKESLKIQSVTHILSVQCSDENIGIVTGTSKTATFTHHLLHKLSLTIQTLLGFVAEHIFCLTQKLALLCGKLLVQSLIENLRSVHDFSLRHITRKMKNY